MNIKKIDVLVLTEGGKDCGFGHLTRTYAVVQAFKREFPRSRIRFEIKGDSSAAIYLRRLGVGFRFTDWFQKNKADTLRLALRAQAVLIDSYHAPLGFCRDLANVNSNLIWLDDYGRIAYPAGKIIVPAPYCPAGLFKAAKNCTVFSGADYVILRDAFWDGVKLRRVRGSIKNALLLLGGTGTLRQVKRILTAIPNSEKLNFVWVAPKKKYSRLPRNLKVVSGLSGKQISRLMFWADAAISAGGQTLYELARVGLPSVAIQIAENQRYNIKFFESSGAALSAGRYDSPSVGNRLALQWKQLLNLRVRRKVFRNALKVTDGRGALRVVRLLKGRNG